MPSHLASYVLSIAGNALCIGFKNFTKFSIEIIKRELMTEKHWAFFVS
jgi:hypothetical protein